MDTFFSIYVLPALIILLKSVVLIVVLVRKFFPPGRTDR